jgi:D-lyxose ketol-isomerase
MKKCVLAVLAMLVLAILASPADARGHQRGYDSPMRGYSALNRVRGDNRAMIGGLFDELRYNTDQLIESDRGYRGRHVVVRETRERNPHYRSHDRDYDIDEEDYDREERVERHERHSYANHDEDEADEASTPIVMNRSGVKVFVGDPYGTGSGIYLTPGQEVPLPPNTPHTAWRAGDGGLVQISITDEDNGILVIH